MLSYSNTQLKSLNFVGVKTFHWKLSKARTYIEGLIGYTFIDINLLEEALWAMPVIMANGNKLVDGNLSLAMVGDAVLDFVLIEHCYSRGLACRAIDNCRQRRACNKNLAELARKHGIEQFVISEQTMNEHMRATAVEAVLGAVVRDNGYDYDVLKRVVAAFGII